MIYYVCDFYYCTRHDQGLVIQTTDGINDNVMRSSYCGGTCEYNHRGKLVFENNMFQGTIEGQGYYDRCNGGWLLQYFARSIIDENQLPITNERLELYFIQIEDGN